MYAIERILKNITIVAVFRFTNFAENMNVSLPSNRSFLCECFVIAELLDFL